MQERNDLIAAFRQEAAFGLLLLLGIAVTSAYVIQRAMLVLTSALPALFLWSPSYQISISGLQFRYATMTIAWPLVVGGFALAFCMTHSRWSRTGRLLAGDARGLSDDELRNVSPLALPDAEAVSASGRLAFRILGMLPLVALALHGAAGFGGGWLLLSHRSQWPGNPASWLVFLGLGALLVTSLLGMMWTVRFTRVLWPRRRKPMKPSAVSCAPVAAVPAVGPWQVFLSAKKLSPGGRPTRDMEMAEMLHDFLTERGLRVFLSTRSLEQMGAASFKAAIDSALDQATILVAVGTSQENLSSGWVKYEWDSFINDIISGLKPGGCVFSYIEGMRPADLPRPLRQSEAFQNDLQERERLLGYIHNAPALAGPDGDSTSGLRVVRHSSSLRAGEASLWRRPAGIALLSTAALLVVPALWDFATKPYERSRMQGFWAAMQHRPAASGFDTGWIFLGYLDVETGVFVEGPYARVAFRATSSERGSIEPRLGDVLKISKDRRLVIADFRTKGAANELVSPPTVHSTLGDDDFTGRDIAKGSFVIVRDIEISGEPGRPGSVWCRISDCDPDTEGCNRAEAESRE